MKFIIKRLFAAAVFLAMEGCTPVAEESVVCKSFSFQIQKNEWLEARRLMHEISIVSPGGPYFSDESYEDPADRRFLRAKIERKGTGIVSRLDARIFRDGETATFKVVDTRVIRNSKPCNLWSGSDYMTARDKFSSHWRISESTEKIRANPMR